ncbi:CPBP family intramembrane glutamic endopeptidase [Cellulophaga sp. BC115SP]|uniref:CPBP family intramembrane glutamic endopeptidase n=1 Tax=Cellulophaga sp. BC115SP TaxID=2683263 RepID=UPI00141261E8|nr:CPBP family intramembrane glutamic endopeptidase [Cellulophaga sp. BC115SP]NBB31712.1 CPBP family intramembrane metalloprotease [Cellulophaga sp. BC115SP]
MMKIIIESILPILVLLPLIPLFISDRNQIKKVVLFSLIFIFYQIILKLPITISEVQFIHSKWNWTGKIFSSIFGVLIYYLLQKELKPHDFIKLRQEQESFLKTLSISSFPVCIALFSYFDTSISFDAETLLFQMTLPGVDEEIMFRAILLGLIIPCFKEGITVLNTNIGNPSVLFVALLFGLVHGLTITNNYKLYFDYYPIIWTSFYGYLWGWISIKSKSILQAIISHNMCNFIMFLIRMIK